MEKRQVGNSDLHVAPIMFGGNVLGWTIDEKQSFEVLDAFVIKALILLTPRMCIPAGRQGIPGANQKPFWANG